MANSNGWGDGAANNSIGWGQGANNAIGWGSVYAVSDAGLTDIIGDDLRKTENNEQRLTENNDNRVTQ